MNNVGDKGDSDQNVGDDELLQVKKSSVIELTVSIASELMSDMADGR